MQFMYNYVVLTFSILKAERGREMHAVSCAAKSVFGFIARDCIQECREACGGHGYLAGLLNDIKLMFQCCHYTYM